VFAALEGYARQVAIISLENDPSFPEQAQESNWKTIVANTTGEDIYKPVEATWPGWCEKIQALKPRICDGDSLRASLAKIANNVGQITRMIFWGLDPRLLSMTPDEANEAMLKLAMMCQMNNKPVITVNSQPGEVNSDPLPLHGEN